MSKLRVIEVLPGEDVMHLVTRQFDLEYLQHFVGGYIEHVTFVRTEDPDSRLGGYVNEEGLIKNLPVNRIATELYYGAGPNRPLPPRAFVYPICGPLVILGGPDAGGDDMSVPDEYVDALRTLGYSVVAE